MNVLEWAVSTAASLLFHFAPGPSLPPAAPVAATPPVLVASSASCAGDWSGAIHHGAYSGRLELTLAAGTGDGVGGRGFVRVPELGASAVTVEARLTSGRVVGLLSAPTFAWSQPLDVACSDRALVGTLGQGRVDLAR